MKDLMRILGIFTVFVIAIPMLGFFTGRDKTDNAAKSDETVVSETSSAAETAMTAENPEALPPADEKFKVLDFTSGQVITMTMRDYVIGAVLGEMPATYNTEALKAQAVAAHTYAVRRKQQQLEAPDPELMGAYISNDSTKYQAFFTPEQAKSFYGSGYDEYNKKVAAAVDDVINEILVYNGEPIVAAFHAMSSGKTESAEVVWGNAVDYLVPVESEEDRSAPTFKEEKTFTADELSARLTESGYGITLPDDKSEWIKIESVSDSGTVLKVSAGDKTLSGMEMRLLLDLRSACFTVEYDGGSFVFTSEGNGHGVGMSQYGANAMAEKGSSYKEILLYYYKGAEIEEPA